jgi:hypothetical protein
MSTPFYDLASLVVVPSGYKASKVYAQKPQTTDGQLAFTRSTTASRIAPNGLLEKVRTNVLLQSNSFDTSWSFANANVTGGQSGYDGSNDAWLLSKTATFGRIQIPASVSGVHTASLYVKAGTLSWIRFLMLPVAAGTDPQVYVNLSDGSLGSQYNNITATSTSVGGGWYRITLTFQQAVTEFRIYPADANNNVSGTSGNIYIQDAQLEAGDIATDYIATTTAAVSVGPVANVPRLDYLGSSCPRLLLEPQRVNLALFSESLDNAYWTNAEATTVSANVGVSPDGYTNADKLIPQATSNFHRLSRSFTVTTATPYTFSAFVKRAGYDYFLIRTSDAGNNNIGYDLLNGTVTYTASGYTSFIESYGNDWYRIGFVRSFTASTITINFRPNPTIISTNSLDNFTGDGTSGGFVWGATARARKPTPPRTSTH